MKEPRRLLAVFAHPDDESFGTGGTLSRYAAEGVEVHLITATCGEAGEIASPELATSENLAEVRAEELRCACATYGINPPHILGYPDGGLTSVNQLEAVEKVTRLLRQLRPQVVVTFGPDGTYGHYDHIAVHHWTSAAVDMAADPAAFPQHFQEGLQPHRVQKLYYRAMPEAQLAAFRKQGSDVVMMDGVPYHFIGYPDCAITTRLDVTAFAERKWNGIQCHATQIRPGSRFANPGDEDIMQWFNQETYLLARSEVPMNGQEDDLFRGIE